MFRPAFGERLAPLGLVGGSALISDGDLGHGVNFGLHYGLGAEYEAVDRLWLRAGVRHLIADDSDGGLASGLDARIGFDYVW